MTIFGRTKRLVGHAARLVHLKIGAAVRRLLTSKAPALQSETPSEIEYYSKLPNNTHLARQALYDRRWVAVAARLQGQNPEQITSENLAFQKAICKVEIEMPCVRGRGPCEPTANASRKATTFLISSPPDHCTDAR